MSELNMSELSIMVEKVFVKRYVQKLNDDKGKFESSIFNFSGNGFEMEGGNVFIGFDFGFDEVFYRFWVEKFKEIVKSNDKFLLELESISRRVLFEEKFYRVEVVRKKAEDKKLVKW